MSVLTTVSTTRMNITIIVGKDTNEHLHSYPVHPSQRTRMDITIIVVVRSGGEIKGKKPAFNRLFSICSHFLLFFSLRAQWEQIFQEVR